MNAITLTADEVHLAATHGLLRRLQKHRGNRGDRAQRSASTWDNEIEGACAELALCKMRGVYWSGVGGLRAKDGGTLDIRWTKHHGTGGLIVYEHEDDETVVVLMDGFAPTYSVVGWMTVGEAKRDGERKDFGVLVPRHKLHQMKERAIA